MFFIIVNYYFQVSFNLKVVLHMALNWKYCSWPSFFKWLQPSHVFAHYMLLIENPEMIQNSTTNWRKKMKLLPSLFSCVYSRMKLFVIAMNSRRRYSIFECRLYLRIRRKELKIRSYLCRFASAVNVMLNLSNYEGINLARYKSLHLACVKFLPMA